jgi:hypothetical protein
VERVSTEPLGYCDVEDEESKNGDDDDDVGENDSDDKIK